MTSCRHAGRLFGGLPALVAVVHTTQADTQRHATTAEERGAVPRVIAAFQDSRLLQAGNHQRRRPAKGQHNACSANDMRSAVQLAAGTLVTDRRTMPRVRWRKISCMF